MKNNSLYLIDSTENDVKIETIMDYTISWVLRRAQEDFRNEKPVLFNYCREILAKLLGMECSDDLLFLSVNTWKQIFHIDLWVEVKLSVNGVVQKHAVLIENKLHTGLTKAVDEDGEKRCQLTVYRKKFDGYYVSNKLDFVRHYALITAMSRDSDRFDSCYAGAGKFGFSVFTLEDLHDYESEDSESDIFNEFWSRNW